MYNEVKRLDELKMVQKLKRKVFILREMLIKNN